jgi:hypothetical protein
MANTAISGLTASAADLAATDILPVVQTTGIGPVKMTGQQLAGGLLGSTTLSGATVTANAPVLNLEQTWNNSGVTFTGLKFNATDTASNANSLLMDLQTTVSGTKTSRFKVLKGGAVVSAGSITSLSSSGDAVLQVANSPTYGYHMASGYAVSWGSSVFLNGSIDLTLRRRDAANLALGAVDSGTPVAQTLSVQGGSGTNIAGANFTIAGSQSTGSGKGGSIILSQSASGSSGINQNALVNAYVFESLASGQTNGILFRWNSATEVELLRTDSAATSNMLRLITNGGGITAPRNFRTARVGFGASVQASVAFVEDLALERDAANTLALRNGAAAQTFRVYNTWANAGADYERLSFIWSSNLAIIRTESAGTGVARELVFGTGGGAQWFINTSGHFGTYGSNNVYDIGASGGNRPRNVYVGTSVFTGTGGINFDINSRLRSPADGQITLFNAALNDFGRLNFGGTTSSFPALKRSTTTLQARLADDSDFGSIQGKLTTETAYTAGAPTATGYIVLYDSTGTAYKVPAEAL